MKKLNLFFLLFIAFKLNAQDTINVNQFLLKENLGVKNNNLKIDGFYYHKNYSFQNKKDTINSISPIILYKDGTIMSFDNFDSGYSTIRKKKCKLKPKQKHDKIIDFFSCYLKDVERGEVFSIYTTTLDSIKIQTITPYYFFERKGIILNDSTFVITKVIDYISKDKRTVNKIYHLKTTEKPKSNYIKTNAIIRKYFLE